jgi:hypothetical protein
MNDLIGRTIANISYEGPNFEPCGDGLYYPPLEDRSRPHAVMKILNGDLHDHQPYLALRDERLNPATGVMERGYHVLKFPAGTKDQDLDRVAAEAYDFITDDRFDACFEPYPQAALTEKATQRLQAVFMMSVQPSFMKNPILIARRKLDFAELCLADGIYAETPPSLRFRILKDMVVLHHPQSFPEVIEKDQAFKRLYRREDNAPVLALKP